MCVRTHLANIAEDGDDHKRRFKRLPDCVDVVDRLNVTVHLWVFGMWGCMSDNASWRGVRQRASVMVGATSSPIHRACAS